MKKKNIIAISMCIFLLLGICACEKENDWLFSLNGEQLYSKDVAVFAYIYVMEHNIQNTEELENLYESGKTYEEYHKEQLEEDIIETILLYKEAEAKNIKLSKEDKEQIKLSTDNVIERFGEIILEEADISKEDIRNVYEMKLLGNAYMESISDDGESEKGTEEKNVAQENTLEQNRYVKVYQVTFPVVELDENGMIQSDAEGNLKKLSRTEIEKMQQDASDFAAKAKSGESMESLLVQCDERVTAIEKYLKYNDLETAYQRAIDQLSEGSVSDVIESDYGYYVIRLINKEDEDYSETIVAHQQESEMIADRENELERLYSAYAEANKEYKNNELWKQVDLEQYVK